MEMIFLLVPLFARAKPQRCAAFLVVAPTNWLLLLLLLLLLIYTPDKVQYMKKRKEKKKIAEKWEVWTSGQLDSVPSPTEGLRAPGLTTGPHMYSTEIGSVIYITKNTTKKI